MGDPRRRTLGLAAALLAGGLAAILVGAMPDDGDEIVRRARALEAERVALVEKLAPAVVAMFRPTGQGGGSGVIIDPEGYVLTNFHVTGDSTEMRAGLPDGRVLVGDVVGLDPYSDLALIKLQEPGPYPWAPIAPPNSAKVGDWTLAMGNPFLLATDFKPTVTMGIVSGTNRFLPGSGRQLIYTDCVQVDTPINPGNSGGPLFDMEGRILGINGRISGRDRGRVNVGVGFAVSANQIHEVLADLRAGKLVEHGYLEATVWETEDETAERGFRVVIDNMYEDSAAAKAGLKLGDEIFEFEGLPVRGQNDFLNRIGILPMGRRVTVRYRREGDGGAWTEGVAHATLARYPSANPEMRRAHSPDGDHVAWETERILRRARKASGLRQGQGLGVEILRRDAEGAEKRFHIYRKDRGLGVMDVSGHPPRSVIQDLPGEAPPESRTGAAGQARLESQVLAALADPTLDGFELVRFAGGDKIRGEIFLVVEARFPGDRTAWLLFDRETHRLRGYHHEDPGSGATFLVLYSDFREVDGRWLPNRTERGTLDRTLVTETVERVLEPDEVPPEFHGEAPTEQPPESAPERPPEKPKGEEF